MWCLLLFCGALLIGAVGVLHTGYLKLHLSCSFYTIQVGDLCKGPAVSDVDSSNVTLGGPMFIEGGLTHPCHSFAIVKPAMVVVQVQGALRWLYSGRKQSLRPRVLGHGPSDRDMPDAKSEFTIHRYYITPRTCT